MKNLYHNLLLLIAGSTQKQLAAQIQYLKAENEVLRARLPSQVKTTAQERTRLVKFGEKLGKAIEEIVTIVKPSTMLRWIKESKKPGGITPVRRGRRRTKQQTRELIIRMARENDWGCTRITEQAKSFLKHTEAEDLEVRTLMRDRDTKYQIPFDQTFQAAGVEVKVGAVRRTRMLT